MNTKTKTGESVAPGAAAPQNQAAINGANVISEIKSDLSKKLLRISELQRLILQRQRVQDFKTDLVQFTVSAEEDKMFLRFEDENRHRVETSNPALIKKVQECLMVAMDEKLLELDNKLVVATI